MLKDTTANVCLLFVSRMCSVFMRLNRKTFRNYYALINYNYDSKDHLGNVNMDRTYVSMDRTYVNMDRTYVEMVIQTSISAY